MSLFRYSGLSTKVKAMKGRLLSPEQFREMSDLHSVPEVLSYLKKMPSYEKVLADKDEAHLHRGAAEALVKQSLYYDFGKLYRFADLEQRVFLEDYFMRYEVIFLKMCCVICLTVTRTGRILICLPIRRCLRGIRKWIPMC